jgi:putative hydrolase of the HAD superfamily
VLKPKFILFDCMETLVDVEKIPDIRMYSSFAYFGCGYEELWRDFDHFVEEYKYAKIKLEENQIKYKEHNLFDRFRFMVKQKSISESESDKALADISANYWRNYKANCYVEEEVKAVLKALHSSYRCGVVSNFMVDGGVEELLRDHGIAEYFEFVVTSIKVGWRKPHREIYDTALKLSKVEKEEILFIGDDYICDYVGPKEYGYNAVLLDKKEGDGRFRSLKELVDEMGLF